MRLLTEHATATKDATEGVPMNGHVLIVDDDSSMSETLTRAMNRRGFVAVAKSSAAEALQALEEQDFDVVVSDLHMDGMDGLAFCERVVANRPDLPVVMITAFGSLESAVAALRVGAYDFITKPFDVELLQHTLSRAVQHGALREEVKRLRQAVGATKTFEHMIGSSPPIQKLKELIDRLADVDASLLISGESGTGKELVARAVHERSRRSTEPFVAINCAAVPETLLESELFGHVKGAFTDAHAPRQGLFLKAAGGTLFLDEVAELAPATQAKLLRVLQEHTVRPVGSDREVPYRARIITATNRDLEADVDARQFREDLFYRINVVRIDVPSLRVRGNDILFLAQHFLARYQAQNKKGVTHFSPAVAEKLLGYQWPGNVRELQNCIERAVAFARFEELTVDDLPEKVRNYRVHGASVPGVEPLELVPMEEVERRYILRVLQQVGGKTAASEVLGIDRRTLHRKLLRWGNESAEAPD
jgi:two-component system response regulator HydG